MLEVETACYIPDENFLPVKSDRGWIVIFKRQSKIGTSPDFLTPLWVTDKRNYMCTNIEPLVGDIQAVMTLPSENTKGHLTGSVFEIGGLPLFQLYSEAETYIFITNLGIRKV